MSIIFRLQQRHHTQVLLNHLPGRVFFACTFLLLTWVPGIGHAEPLWRRFKKDWPKLWVDSRPCEVHRVIDGDTTHVNCGDRREKLRLVGIDTPETKHPFKPVEFYGPEASNRAKQLLPVDSKVWLAYGKRPQRGKLPRGRYGRVLAYLFMPNGKMFNAQMVREGFAFAMRRYPHVYMQEFIALETQAKQDRAGMWSNPQKVAELEREDDAYRQLSKKCRSKLGNPRNFQWVIGLRDRKVYVTRAHRSYFRTDHTQRVLFCSVEDATQAGYRSADPGMYVGPRNWGNDRSRSRYKRRSNSSDQSNNQQGDDDGDSGRGKIIIADKDNQTYRVYSRKQFRIFRNEAAAKRAGFRKASRSRSRSRSEDSGSSSTKPDCGGRKPLVANKRSKLYRMPSQRSYRNALRSKNVVFFCTEKEAKQAGYEKAQR